MFLSPLNYHIFFVCREMFQKFQKRQSTPYTQGPDFATGWGRIDAKAALDMIDGYDSDSKTFDKFWEFNIYNGVQRRWTVQGLNWLIRGCCKSSFRHTRKRSEV